MSKQTENLSRAEALAGNSESTNDARDVMTSSEVPGTSTVDSPVLEDSLREHCRWIQETLESQNELLTILYERVDTLLTNYAEQDAAIRRLLGSTEVQNVLQETVKNHNDENDQRQLMVTLMAIRAILKMGKS